MNPLLNQFMQASPAPARRRSLEGGHHASAAAAASSSSSASRVNNPDLEQVYLHLQQQISALAAQQQQQLPPPSSSAFPPSPTDAMTEAIARALAANSPLSLPLFDGSGNASGIAAHSWLRQAERAFEEREGIAGPLSDGRRIGAASIALRGSAETWYSSLPQRPSTWNAFKVALTSRFQPASARLLIEGKLQSLVDNTAKIRERLNTQGLERYTALYQQLANQIPSEMMLERTKVMLYAKGLPARMHELVVQAEEAAYEAGKPLELNIIVDKILKRAATRDAASGSQPGPSAGSHTSGDAMDLSAVDLCCRTFGLSAAEARDYLEASEGWAVHDTSEQTARTDHSGSSSYPPQAPLAEGGQPSVAHLIRQVNALQAQLAALSRRTVSPPVKREVPELLAAERRTAGLCIRCGVAKYEAGGRGHNSRTCQAPVDTTTSAAAGSKRAGLSVFQ
jgi:hypothetical protein